MALLNPKFKALIVERDESLVDDLREFILKLGFKVISADGSGAAANWLARSAFDLILVNQWLERRDDGLDFIRNMIPRMGKAKIILMTSFFTKAKEKEALGLGAVACLDRNSENQDFFPALRNAIISAVHPPVSKDEILSLFERMDRDKILTFEGMDPSTRERLERLALIKRFVHRRAEQKAAGEASQTAADLENLPKQEKHGRADS